ncbi:hypothetical protein [Allorhizobium taibaishanense]|uniref:Uncharacterized protein n=1 Tax=Allorhizobium taibaishanense TaxID=887144 RepID=A0A1Q9A9D5_9HYPH|nr:hypothetical protein [Allorhizobium taibaishanense]MBB4009855.1 hypothetical protein [Allorhizobium taibaishanense]OLP51490.1 hypothetical protein BJF91_15695 [Allorhizobium taibaishanense]
MIDSAPSHDITQEDLLGRINAHRELLIALMTAGLKGPDAVRDLVQDLEQEAQLSDGQEDPGAVPNRALAEAIAAQRETRDILAAARARAGQSDPKA